MKPTMFFEHGEYNRFPHVRWFYAHVNNTVTHRIITESDWEIKQGQMVHGQLNLSHSDATIRYSVKKKTQNMDGNSFIYIFKELSICLAILQFIKPKCYFCSFQELTLTFSIFLPLTSSVQDHNISIVFIRLYYKWHERDNRLYLWSS